MDQVHKVPNCPSARSCCQGFLPYRLCVIWEEVITCGRLFLIIVEHHTMQFHVVVWDIRVIIMLAV